MSWAVAADREARDVRARRESPDLVVKLARGMQADYEIDDFDVAQVERTAEDRRGFEAVDLAGG